MEAREVTDTSRVRNKAFLSKIMSAEQAAELVPNGAIVGFSGFVGSGCPLLVPPKLAERAKRLHAAGQDFKISILSGASTDPNVDGVLAEAEAVAFRTPFFTDKNLRAAVNSGKTGYMDVHLSSLAGQVEAGFFGKMDCAIIEVTGITEEGKLIPSTSIGNNPLWLKLADKIILEVNTIQPPELEGIHDVALLGIAPNRKPIGISRVSDRIGSPYMDVDPNKVVAVVLTESGDRVNKFNPPDPVSTAIGDHVVAFLKQEEAAGRLPKGRLLPLQSGIGNVANAVLAGLARAGYRGLECYTEVIQDGLLYLIRDGVVDMASTATISLSPDAVAEFRRDVAFYSKHIILRPQEFSNNPEVIRRIGVIGMNGMLEADIYGNVNSTHIMGTGMMNGIGGSGDFARNGYISIFLTGSTAKNGAISSIVPFAAHIDHTEHDTMVVVTEYGFADLRGKCPRDRARAMIAIAHPDYRPMLQDYFDRACAQPKPGQTPHILSEALSWHDRYVKTGTMKP